MARKKRVFSVSTPTHSTNNAAGFAANRQSDGHHLHKYAASFTPITCLHSVSPSVIVSGGDQAIVWDVKTNVEKKVLTNKNSNPFVSIFVTHTAEYILTANKGESKVFIFAYKTGELMKSLEGHNDEVNSIVVSSDDKYIVSGSSDCRILIWSLLPGKIFSTEAFDLLWNLQGHSDAIYSVVITPKNSHIVSGGADKQIKIWDFHSGECRATLAGHNESISQVSVSLDTKFVVSCGGHQIKIFDFKGESCIRTISQINVVTSFAISGDAKFVYYGLVSGKINCVDILTGQTLRSFHHHSNCVRSLIISRDEMLISSDNKGNVFTFDIATGRKGYNETIRGHDEEIDALCPTKTNYVISVGRDHLIKVWDMSTLNPVLTLDNKCSVTICQCTDNEEFIITADTKNQLKIWRFDIDESAYEAHRLRAGSVVDLAPTGAYLVCTLQCESPITAIIPIETNATFLYSCGGGIHVVELDNFTKVQTITLENALELEAVEDDLETFAEDAHGRNYQQRSSIARSSFLGRMRLGSRTKKIDLRTADGDDEIVTCISRPLRLERIFVSGTSGGQVNAWEYLEGDNYNKWVIASHLQLVGSIKTMVASNHKHLSEAFVVVVTSEERNIKIVNFDPFECIKIISHSTSIINSVAISNDSRYIIVVGGADRLINVYDESGTLVRTMEGHTKEIKSVCVNGDGVIVSGGRDKGMFSWNLSKFLLSLPFIVQEVDFRRDLEEAKKSESLYAWPRVMRAISIAPEVLCEPRLCDTPKSYTNLVHIASQNGRDDLLGRVLTSTDERKQKIAFAAVLLKDKDGKNALQHAMIKKSAPCVREIFKCYRKLLGHTFAVGNGVEEIALTDLVEVADLCTALIEFPSITVDFLAKSLHLLPALDSVVKLNVERFPIRDDEQLVLGSVERNPLNFWQEFCYPVAEKKKKKKNSATSVTHSFSESEQTLSENEVSRERRRSSRSLAIDDHKLMNRKFGSYFRAASVDNVGTGIQVGIPVSARLVPIRAVVNSNFLSCVVKACESQQKYTLCENEVVSAIIQYFWEHRVQNKFRKNLFFYLFFVAVFSVDSLLYRDAVPYLRAKPPDQIRAYILFFFPSILSLVMWGYFARHEILQLRATKFLLNANVKNKKRVLLRKHLFGLGIWNAMDTLTLLSVLAVYVTRLLEFVLEEYEFFTSSMLLAVALPSMYLNSLFYLQGFESSGKLVCMIVGIFRGIGVFLLILTDIIVGFALGFLALERINGDVVNKRGMLRSVFDSYVLMLTNEGETLALEEGGVSPVVVLSITLFIVFTVLINIVLLNLLIALMGDIFDRIQENARAQFLFSRARIILEFESIVAPEQLNSEKGMGRATDCPKWLQVLVPTSSVHRGGKKAEGTGTGDHWGGKMRAIKNGQQQVYRNLRSDIESIRGDMNERMCLMNEEMTVMKLMLERIGSKLQVQHTDVSLKKSKSIKLL